MIKAVGIVLCNGADTQKEKAEEKKKPFHLFTSQNLHIMVK
jgi:hypothetical protein